MTELITEIRFLEVGNTNKRMQKGQQDDVIPVIGAIRHFSVIIAVTCQCSIITYIIIIVSGLRYFIPGGL